MTFSPWKLWQTTIWESVSVHKPSTYIMLLWTVNVWRKYKSYLYFTQINLVYWSENELRSHINRRMASSYSCRQPTNGCVIFPVLHYHYTSKLNISFMESDYTFSHFLSRLYYKPLRYERAVPKGIPVNPQNQTPNRWNHDESAMQLLGAQRWFASNLLIRILNGTHPSSHNTSKCCTRIYVYAKVCHIVVRWYRRARDIRV